MARAGCTSRLAARARRRNALRDPEAPGKARRATRMQVHRGRRRSTPIPAPRQTPPRPSARRTRRTSPGRARAAAGERTLRQNTPGWRGTASRAPIHPRPSAILGVPPAAVAAFRRRVPLGIPHDSHSTKGEGDHHPERHRSPDRGTTHHSNRLAWSVGCDACSRGSSSRSSRSRCSCWRSGPRHARRPPGSIRSRRTPRRSQRTEQEFAAAEAYQEQWREEEKKHQPDTLL